jgi:hypothetical protein
MALAEATIEGPVVVDTAAPPFIDLLEGRAGALKEFRRRNSEFDYCSVHRADTADYIEKNWEVVRRGVRLNRLKRPKRHDKRLEDRAWCLLYRMGYQDKCGDFMFVDPPYTVKHNMNGFNKYNEKLFRWEDQIRLRDAIERAAHRGVAIVLTNADHGSVRELYASVLDYAFVSRASVLAGDGSRRGTVTESIFSLNL